MEVRTPFKPQALFTDRCRYKITISIPKDSRLKTPDDDKATTQQKARVFLKKELTDELGEHFVFDGTSLGWSTKCIVEEKKNITFTINMEKRKDNAPNKIDVNVYNMGKLDLKKFKEYIEKGVYEKNPTGNADWEDIIKWVQAAFRKDPEQRLVAKPKSNAFYVKNESFEEKLGSLLDSRKGVFQTMQLRFGRMTLNVDTATTAFWRSNLNLLDVVLQQCRTQNPAALTNYWQNKRADFLNDIRRIPGVYFYTPHVNEYHKKINKDNKDWEERPHQRMKMTGFCSGTALTHKFPKDKTKPNDLTTVFAYFKEKYGITVKYPNLPLIEFGKGNVPMELCWSCADEQFKGEMDSYEKAKFVK